MKAFFISCLVFFFISSCATSSKTKPPKFVNYSFLQLGPNTSIIAKHITHLDQCPSIKYKIKDKFYENKMLVFSEKEEDFPVLICFSELPKNSKNIEISGKKLNGLSEKSNTALIIGDTGCRLNKKNQQSCLDPNQWPTQKIAEQASKEKIDFIIHTGDYLYREAECPADNPGCAGSPYGDNWDVWEQDFFIPTQTLQTKAPFIFVRGNHEDCERTPKGWHKILSPKPQSTCSNTEDPYLIELNNKISFIVFDASLAKENKKNKNYNQYFETVKKLSQESKSLPIFLTHIPVWQISPTGELYVGGQQHALLETKSFDAFDFAISGHVHLFQLLGMEKQQGLQVIVGNGGALLHPTRNLEGNKQDIRGLSIQDYMGYTEFGYSLLSKKSKRSWKLINKSVTGSTLKNCSIEKRLFNCK